MSSAAPARQPQPAILGYFHWLDRLLKDAVARAKALYNAGQSEEAFRGLYISEQEIDTLVDRQSGMDTIGTPVSGNEFLAACESLPGIENLSATWNFTAFDHAVLLLALAPEVDVRYERIYSYLQDDITRRNPTVDLALNLLSSGAASRIVSRARFGAGAPLVRSGMLRLVPDPGHVEPPLLAYYLRLEEPAVRMLLGDNRPDPRLESFCEIVTNVVSPELTSDVLRRLPAYIAGARDAARPVRLLFAGPATSSKRQAAGAVAAAEKASLMIADLSRTTAWRSDPVGIAAALIQQGDNLSAVLHIEGIEIEGDAAPVRAFTEKLLEYPGTVIIAADSATTIAAIGSERVLAVEFPLPDFQARRNLWRSALTSAGLTPLAGTVSTLANQFELSPEQITAAVAAARRQLQWRATSGEDPTVDDVADELAAAARGQNGLDLASLTTRVKPVYRWQDIVLPPDSIQQLKEICQRVTFRHDVLDTGGFAEKFSAGKGVAVLFAGPSGTGKTMAAEVIASELKLDLFRIDLSTVVSKYVGETEKQLEKIFKAAQRSSNVLLFDEADALFGKRSEVRDAHDRYANIEISYLLQKMEQYEGITILTTNLRGNLDEAFLRRLAFTVHFPFPEEADRLKIWQRIWPAQTQLERGLDFSALAKLKLSGGNIKNIALSTAFLAAAESKPVSLGKILHAVRREYEKAGKILMAAELEAAVAPANGRAC